MRLACLYPEPHASRVLHKPTVHYPSHATNRTAVQAVDRGDPHGVSGAADHDAVNGPRRQPPGLLAYNRDMPDHHDTKKAPRRWLQFSITGLLTITTIVAILIAWYLDRRTLRIETEHLRVELQRLQARVEFERAKADVEIQTARMQVEVAELDQLRLRAVIDELLANLPEVQDE